MMRVTHLDAGKLDRKEVLALLDRDAAVILENAFPVPEIAVLLGELEPFIAGTAPYDDAFIGRATTRTGALVARSRTAREVVMHPAVLDAAEDYLHRFAENHQLNLTQIMRLLPGQGAQKLHRDRYLWSRHLPREIEPMMNSMWALTDFTEENGATRVIPGSHLWDWDRAPQSGETIAAEMPAGSVLLYTGSVLHGGGENRSQSPRIGMNITYLLGWLRQEENQYLSCPPEVARQLDPKLRALLGYSIGNGGLGYFSPLEPAKGHPDTLPPEFAVSDPSEVDASDVAEQSVF